MRFAPGKPLTIAALLGLVVLCLLGTWQARKIGPKTALITSIQNGLKGDAVSLASLPSETTSAQDYQRVSFDGAFLPGTALALYGTNLSGRSGKHLYGAIRTANGRTIVASLGWVPFDAPDYNLPTATTRFSGVLVPEGQKGPFTSENDPDGNFWYWAEIDSMAAVFGATSSFDHRVILDAQDGAAARGLPLGGQVRVNIPNDHFEYALTWFGLGLALLGVYIAFGLQRGREDSA